MYNNHFFKSTKFIAFIVKSWTLFVLVLKIVFLSFGLYLVLVCCLLVWFSMCNNGYRFEPITEAEIYQTLPYLKDLNMHQNYDLYNLSLWDPSMKRLLERRIVEELNELPALPMYQIIFKSVKIAMDIDFVNFMCGSVNIRPTVIDTKSIASCLPLLRSTFSDLNIACISHDGLGNYNYDSHRVLDIMLEDFGHHSLRPIDELLKRPNLTEYELNQLLIYIKYAKLKLFHFEMFYSKSVPTEFLPSYFYDLHFELDKLQEEIVNKLASLK